ncbi:hypothetical protein GCM10017083_35830 [Thalassobaculum fulvum]|uniref:Uncharacterized protein n=1 Tax=Thalassobaculum fulvum TaxID=1633335 RepID=A0A918XV31_9PROT|nr:hypothetical protein [Thalassobaculum fulvum]GHD56108.1 hypothetical protein GCM10017083_35830 [Thalassobaculum fulvum]
MFRIATLFALATLLAVGWAGAAAAEIPSGAPIARVAAYADRNAESSGLPPVTYEEIVGQPRASAGYSMTAIALGAVAGVVAANTVLPMLGYSAVSAALAGAPVTGATLEAALATSRLVAVGAAVTGGVIGQWVYSGWGR